MALHSLGKITDLVATGKASNRPGSPVLGNVRFNTDEKCLEYWDGAQWMCSSVDKSMIGEIVMYGGTSAPRGWLECDGRSTAPYPDLAAVVGAKVPDLRGEFVRGWDHGRGVDSGRILLRSQDEEFKSHSHSMGGDRRYIVDGGPIICGPASDPPWGKHWMGTFNGTGVSNTGGRETRPRNVALMFIIYAG